jgi:hypothetical protein
MVLLVMVVLLVVFACTAPMFFFLFFIIILHLRLHGHAHSFLEGQLMDRNLNPCSVLNLRLEEGLNRFYHWSHRPETTVWPLYFS